MYSERLIQESWYSHAHAHRDHREKHPAHHATHEKMCDVCAQLQPVYLRCVKIFEDLSTIKKSEECESGKEDAIGRDYRLCHAERHTTRQKKHIAHAHVHEDMNGISLERGVFSVFAQQDNK